MRTGLPTGTVTLVFSDIEGSTRLTRELGAAGYADALAAHRRVVRDAARTYGGVEVDTQGDSFFLAFSTPAAALAAAAAIGAGLEATPIRVRIGVHTGTPLLADEGYVGTDVTVAARIAAAANGGQVLVSAATAALVREAAGPLRHLGEHRLKDVDEPLTLFQLGTESFPPPRTIGSGNLPRPASRFVGRERELAALRALLADGARLVTLTGPGGTGKTRLALEAASALAAGYKAGAYWVPLGSVADPALLESTIAATLGARQAPAEHIGDRELLLVLDNFEHLVEEAPLLSALLARCPNLTLLVTSREVLRLDGEEELAVPPLDGGDAVDLFCSRARMDPSPEIAELCRRLDALPLAIEIAAARSRSISPAQLLSRLAERLDLEGRRDAEPRQQTLRSTIAWSYDLLSADEQQLFARLSTFAGGWTLAAAEAVAGATIDLLHSLVEKSLVRFAAPRYTMLETIRAFAAEQLAPDDAVATRARLRRFIVELAAANAAALHSGAEREASRALVPELANIRGAVADALGTGAVEDVARIVGGLYPLLLSRGHVAEALRWSEAALARPERLSTEGRAEALMGGSEIARFAGELDRALELKTELASYDGDLQRPNWRAALLADLSEIALDQDDVGAARRYAERSAEAGGGVRAHLCFAEVALRTGDLAAAESEAQRASSLLDEGSFNHAASLELLAETARRRGDQAAAAARFATALRAFADLGDGGGTADCLDGMARLAQEDGDGDRAARLAQTAEAIRRDHGRRPARSDLPPVPRAGAPPQAAPDIEDVVSLVLEPD